MLDVIAAVIPDGPAAPIALADIGWNEVADKDYAAGLLITMPVGISLQLTRFLHGGEVLAESDQTAIMSSDGVTADVIPNVVSEIQYPDYDDTASPRDVHTFKYTINGKLAQRTDQRDVKLDYDYGGRSSCNAIERLTEVSDTFPEPMVGGGTKRLSFSYNERGQLTTAESHGTSSLINSVTFGYDGYGNLETETLNPINDTGHKLTTTYAWEWFKPECSPVPSVNRLKSITYPSSRQVVLKYGESTADFENQLSRVSPLRCSSAASLASRAFNRSTRLWNLPGAKPGPLRKRIPSPSNRRNFFANARHWTVCSVTTGSISSGMSSMVRVRLRSQRWSLPWQCGQHFKRCGSRRLTSTAR